MDTFKLLIDDYNKIYKMGFVKSVNNNKNSVGLTIEKLLESTGAYFNIPDYYDIEIKALRSYYAAEFDLFNSAPDGKYILATQWLSQRFGYPDRDYKHIKVLKGNVNSIERTKIGLFYSYKLIINDDEQRIYLNIYNYNGRLVSSDIYWDFDTLKEKLERKIKKLAIFGFKKKIINNELYVKYDSLKIYELISFECFIESIRKGYIYVEFKTGVYKNGPYKGKFKDHGTSFRISRNYILKLYKERKLVWDKKKEQFVLIES